MTTTGGHRFSVGGGFAAEYDSSAPRKIMEPPMPTRYTVLWTGVKPEVDERIRRGANKAAEEASSIGHMLIWSALTVELPAMDVP